MRVILSRFAADQLKHILGYHADVAGRRVAAQILENILSAVERLGRNPTIGQAEELLEDRTEGYRRIVEGNYKIVYWVTHESVIVESIFDCRQSPVKIQEFK